MLAKEQRLSREQFSHHFKHGKRFNSTYATLIISISSTFHGAVVVSKKVSKRAVMRNTLRRRTYAQLYQLAKKRSEGVYILVLKPTIAGIPRLAQHQQIRELIEQGVKSTYNSSHV
jgi:ribonuclease P protein component